jgi:hypothetical protein
MFDMGLVFDIEFTEDELEQLPDWTLFNGKILDGISSLPAIFELPPRPANMQMSVNATTWTFVKCQLRSQRARSGSRQIYQLNPPTIIPTSAWSLENLIREFALPNPISQPSNAPVPQKLIVIGVFL